LQLVNTFKHLAAWFLLSDGRFYRIHLTYGSYVHNQDHFYGGALRQNISPYASIFTHSHRNHNIFVWNPLLWPQIQRTFSLSNLTILDILVLLASLIPLYGCFLFPSFSFRLGGLVAPGEMSYLAVIFGSVHGAF